MPIYSTDVYVAEEDMKPGESRAFVLIWNSAASISNPSSKVWNNRQDVSNTVLTGSDSAASNVQLGRFFTAPAGSWGKTFIFEWTATVEGQILKNWLLIPISSLPRGA